MKSLRGKGKWLLVLSAVMSLGVGSMTAQAATLRIRFYDGSRSEWSEDIEEPKVTVNNSEYSPEWSREIDKWVPGKKVTATFTVDGDYSKSNVDVYGGERSSVRRKDGQTIIEATYIPVAKLGAPESAGWSDSTKTKASWKRVPHASQYQIVLYENGEQIKTLKHGTTSIDLLQYMRNGYSYSYEVRAIAKDSSESKYLMDGEYVSSDDSVVQELGDTKGRWYTYNEGKKYRDEAGNYAASAWKMISGKWYYFNEAGYALTGWQAINGKWYYLDSDGMMVNGWQQINGVWYYFNDGGDMATGWVQTEPGKYYYLNGDGSMASNTVIDGQYRLDESGLMVP